MLQFQGNILERFCNSNSEFFTVIHITFHLSYEMPSCPFYRKSGGNFLLSPQHIA